MSNATKDAEFNGCFIPVFALGFAIGYLWNVAAIGFLAGVKKSEGGIDNS